MLICSFKLFNACFSCLTILTSRSKFWSQCVSSNMDTSATIYLSKCSWTTTQTNRTFIIGPTSRSQIHIYAKKYFQYMHVWARAYITLSFTYIYHYSAAPQSREHPCPVQWKRKLRGWPKRKGEGRGWRESEDLSRGGGRDGEGHFRPSPSRVPIYHLLSQGSSQLEVMARLPYSVVQPDSATLAKPRFDSFRQI